jgi:hypothetical protein
MSTSREAIYYVTPFDDIAESDIRPDEDCCLPESGIWTWDHIKVVANFAARHPDKWRTICLKMDKPHATYRELAGKLGISHTSVRRHLQALKFIGQAE